METKLNSTPKAVLDNLAPEKKIHRSLRPKHPWYTSDLRALKRKVRKLKKKWHRYKLESIWVAYKKTRNCYRDCNGDSKQLNKPVTNLMTKFVDNPLPE